MSRYVVGVSGGVDSVVLLHKLAQRPDLALIVAHVDHGIRDDSHHDSSFVKELASLYGLAFESVRLELGPSASEEKARQARYAFLREVARRHDARIVTAHHADDVIESIAINLHRGTGWRGLATHDSDIIRPLLPVQKKKLYEYALHHGLEWHEDETNQSDRYLRNRLRRKTGQLVEHHRQRLLTLREQQRVLKRMIDQELKTLIGPGPSYSRYFFTHIPAEVAIECLRLVTKGKLTRPQRARVLHAIKTALPGKTYLASKEVRLDFTTRNFTVRLIK